MTTMLTVPAERLKSVRSGRTPLKVAMLSTYPPRQCGVGAFAAEMYTSLVDAAPDMELSVCAVDRAGLQYGQEVATVLRQEDQAAYRRTAEGLVAEGIGAVLVQHEFGIYGGRDGSWINSFVTELTEAGVPYIVTLHTVPAQPSRGQAEVLRRLCRDAATVIVLSPTSQRLAAAAGMRSDRLVTIPRGAPEALRAADRGRGRCSVRLELAAVLAECADATVVSSFGLISPNKGLETAIAAVADLAPELPDLRYIIAGATHPEIVRRHGEGYRRSLTELVEQLGVAEHIRFLDFYLTDGELAALLARSSAVLTPYRSRDQVGSGTLTFALAAGCPVVSSAFFYAEDMLATGAGLLAEPGDTAAFTAALRRTLTEPDRLDRMAKAARAAGDDLLWPVIARQVADVVRGAVGATASRRSSAIPCQR